MALNREWHLANQMPKRPTLQQRIEWHAGHSLACACREVPASIRAEVDARLRQSVSQPAGEYPGTGSTKK